MKKTGFPSPRFNPGNSTVHLWQIALNPGEHVLAALKQHLSSAEEEQANRFHFPRDQRRYVIAHGALRMILSHYLDCQPGQVELAITENGKPYLNGTSLQFNLSHSHELALVAITPAVEIGVDVEHIRPLEDMDSLAHTCFSEQEYRQFHVLAAPENLQAFFSCWTRKEAYIKALGEGLSHPLQTFTVSLLPAKQDCLVEIAGKPDEAARWTLRPIDAGMDYAAAFALRAVDITCELIKFNPMDEMAYAQI